MVEKLLSDDPITNLSNERGNQFVETTEHVALNADEEDAETIIRNMRFMAYAIGFEEGYREALKTTQHNDKGAHEKD